MIKTILFDLDGTLLDTAPDFTVVLNDLLDSYGYPRVKEEEVRATVSDGARALIRLGFGIQDDAPDFVHYLEKLLDLYEERIAQTSTVAFEGMEELLTSLSELGFKWGVVTNKPSRFTLPLLEKFDYFDDCGSIICPDHLQHRKPDPEGLLKACLDLSCTPAQCVYVGDHLRDIEAGKNAGMPTIAVTWGYFPSGTDIAAWDADLIVDTPAEIRNYLRKANV